MYEKIDIIKPAIKRPNEIGIKAYFSFILSPDINGNDKKLPRDTNRKGIEQVHLQQTFRNNSFAKLKNKH